MNPMRTAAEIAQAISDEGGSAEEIVRQLTNAADEIEFGWTGAKYLGMSAGPIEPPWEALELEQAETTLSEIEDLIRDRKTVKTADLKKALGHE